MRNIRALAPCAKNEKASGGGARGFCVKRLHVSGIGGRGGPDEGDVADCNPGGRLGRFNDGGHLAASADSIKAKAVPKSTWAVTLFISFNISQLQRAAKSEASRDFQCVRIRTCEIAQRGASAHMCASAHPHSHSAARFPAAAHAHARAASAKLRTLENHHPPFTAPSPGAPSSGTPPNATGPPFHWKMAALWGPEDAIPGRGWGWRPHDDYIIPKAVAQGPCPKTILSGHNAPPYAAQPQRLLALRRPRRST